jgi:hypothetical protein
MKKAQMEMMGLTVIVVLVAIGMLFFISFKMNEKTTQEEPKQEYTDKQLSNNYIQAALKTTTSCKGLNLQELLQDCALRQELVCPSGNSCAEANNTLHNLTNRSLDVWKTAYYFKIQHRTRLLFNESTKGCDEFKPAEATGFQPISIYPDDTRPIMVTLRICKQ